MRKWVCLETPTSRASSAAVPARLQLNDTEELRSLRDQNQRLKKLVAISAWTKRC